VPAISDLDIVLYAVSTHSLVSVPCCGCGIHQDLIIHHYDIDITPDAKTKARKRMVMRSLLAEHQGSSGHGAVAPCCRCTTGARASSARAHSPSRSRASTPSCSTRTPPLVHPLQQQQPRQEQGKAQGAGVLSEGGTGGAL